MSKLKRLLNSLRKDHYERCSDQAECGLCLDSAECREDPSVIAAAKRIEAMFADETKHSADRLGLVSPSITDLRVLARFAIQVLTE